MQRRSNRTKQIIDLKYKIKSRWNFRRKPYFKLTKKNVLRN